ncbi:MAG: carbohydrate ABC transporter permease, partial [Clostridiales bacterium]|nr:carbohydrate ABC transporter permease [Clostridiales bacterium]
MVHTAKRRQPAYGRIVKRAVGKALIYWILAAGMALYSFPFLWMLSTSLKNPVEIMVIPPKWIPSVLQWHNYADAVNYFPFWRYLANTLFIVGMTMIGAVFSSALVGYAFARLRWPGREVWFGVLVATMMLPGAVTMVPQFIMYKNFGWINTYLPLIVPSFAGGAFNIFLLRQFFRTIPMDLSESAKIDGGSEFRIFLQIVLPLCAPALATIAIFSFMGAWNDFMGPLLYINDKMAYTLTYGLRTFQMQFDAKWHLLMAASILVALPTLL